MSERASDRTDGGYEHKMLQSITNTGGVDASHYRLSRHGMGSGGWTEVLCRNEGGTAFRRPSWNEDGELYREGRDG